MLNFILEQMALYLAVFQNCFCCSWKHFWNICAFDKYCMLSTSSVIRVSKHRESITTGSRNSLTSRLRFQFHPRLQVATLTYRSVRRCTKSNTPFILVRRRGWPRWHSLLKAVIGWLSEKEIRALLRVGFIKSLLLAYIFLFYCSHTHSLTHTLYVYIYFLFNMLSYLTYFIGNEQRHKCCNRPKSSLLHICNFPVGKYVNVGITSLSGAMVFLRGVGDVFNKTSHRHYPCTI